MTQSAIILKLEKLLTKGITSEAEALYLMVEVRKLLEQRQAKRQYEYLTFHCDWAVHPTLTGPTAQKILKQFDAVSAHLKTGANLHDLPGLLRMEIDRISKMKLFENELDKFLEANHLPTLEAARFDGWIHFVHLYASIVEDCPLVMAAKNPAASIVSVTLTMELGKAPEQDEAERWFKVGWITKDRNGRSGEIFIINSFSENPHGSGGEAASSATS